MLWKAALALCGSQPVRASDLHSMNLEIRLLDQGFPLATCTRLALPFSSTPGPT